MTDLFYFGVMGSPGHYLHTSTGRLAAWDVTWDVVYYVNEHGETRHIDGTLAPRTAADGKTIYAGSIPKERTYYTTGTECPEGQFLLHVLSNGFTAIQWWDRRQGDARGGCNSTVLMRGTRTAAEMLAAFALHFPMCKARLDKGGVSLIDVTVYPAKPSAESPSKGGEADEGITLSGEERAAFAVVATFMRAHLVSALKISANGMYFGSHPDYQTYSVAASTGTSVGTSEGEEKDLATAVQDAANRARRENRD